MAYVGQLDTASVDISNALLGLPLTSDWVFGKLNSKALNAIGKKCSTKLAAQFGSKLLPGLNVISCIAMLVAAVNQACGNNGFTVNISLKYVSYTSPKDDYTIEGWDIKGLTISTY